MNNTIFINKTAFPQLDFDEAKFLNELSILTFTSPVVNVIRSGDSAAVVFEQDTDGNDFVALTSAASSHYKTTQQDAVRAVVSAAISFGTNLIIDFAAENVLMGITQAGKTKEVADYLADVMRYAQSGSLYEVLAEVNRLQAAGLPAELAPFVTTDRLNAFKLKIEQYLGIV